MSKEVMKLALEALKKCDPALAEELAAWDIDPPLHHVQEASNACGPAIAAIDEALAEQPAQQDYWQEEARRYAQNAEFWRGKYEDATAQQQQPVEWGVDWGKAGDQSCVSIIKRLPGGGIEVLATEYGPPASKPWVGLTTDEMIQVKDRFKLSGVNIAVAFRTIEAKLREKNNG